MRYYNENPQVLHWQATCLKLIDKYNNLVDEVNEGVRNHNELIDEIIRFNRLPWYKKMFYKFKL